MKTTNGVRCVLTTGLGVLLAIATAFECPASTPSTGAFAITPTTPQQAGSSGAVTLTVTVGKEGLHQKGYVLVYWSTKRGPICYTLKNATVSGGQVGSSFEVLTNAAASDANHKSVGLARVTLTSGADLAVGQTITLHGTMNYAKYDTCRFTLRAAVHPNESGEEYALPQNYPISVTSGPAARIWVSAEARPVQNSPARMTVAIVDAYNNQVRNFQETISASASTTVTGLPLNYTFAAADSGARDFSITFPTPGKLTRVTVTSGKLVGVSNPILPRKPSDLGIYFGDIHNHTELSDGIGTADDAYSYGKRVAGVDFGAVTDHDPKDLSANWSSLKDAARRYNQPGRFATLVGYEYSADPTHGHRNVYYVGTGPGKPEVYDYVSSWSYFDMNNIRALTIPHHPNAGNSVNWSPADWSNINNKYQRLVEIYQARGSFELPYMDEELQVKLPDKGSSVQTALAWGHRIGFIASTDSHFARIGSLGEGLTGVFSPNLNRGRMFNRLSMRQCYAVSRDRMLLFFYINGKPMGSELVVAPTTMRHVGWRAIGETAIKRVDLLRNNVIYKSWTGDGVADDMKGAVNYTTTLSNGEWWYLRVLQVNGELGWTSPIWVDPS